MMLSSSIPQVSLSLSLQITYIRVFLWRLTEGSWKERREEAEDVVNLPIFGVLYTCTVARLLLVNSKLVNLDWKVIKNAKKVFNSVTFSLILSYILNL